MSGVIYKKVAELAEQLMERAEADDQQGFDQLYDQLYSLCVEEEGSKREHPVLWETLADFTDENLAAIGFYQKAFLLADKLKDNEFKASIQFSLAQRLLEEGRDAEAVDALLKAEKFASFTDDDELQQDIASLLQE